MKREAVSDAMNRPVGALDVAFFLLLVSLHAKYVHHGFAAICVWISA